MFKPYHFLLLLIISSLSFISCQKEATLLSDKRIAKVTGNGTTFKYTYDAQKRLIKQEQINDTTLAATISFDYSQNNKVIETTKDDKKVIYKLVYLLDASGKAIKYYSIDPNTNIEDTTQAVTFKYNADSQLSETIYPKNSNGYTTKSVSTYSGGNLIKVTRTTTASNGEITSNSTAVYEYNPVVVNTIDNEHYGKSFLGKDSKNSFSKYTYTNVEKYNGVTTNYTTLRNNTYEVNTEGLITRNQVNGNWTVDSRSHVISFDNAITYQ